jgi:RNA polymerase sigma factor (TIGR02999 family)
MSDATEILRQISSGDPNRAEELLPLVYDELRRLARNKLSQERPGQSLSATALVHEAFVRLQAGQGDFSWDGRAHFFAAAAEAMRRILIEQARRKKAKKRGGEEANRVALDEHIAIDEPTGTSPEELLALDEALAEFEEIDPDRAKVVKLHFFGGLTLQETADAVGVSLATVKRQWTFARAWLFGRIQD